MMQISLMLSILEWNKLYLILAMGNWMNHEKWAFHSRVVVEQNVGLLKQCLNSYLAIVENRMDLVARWHQAKRKVVSELITASYYIWMMMKDYEEKHFFEITSADESCTIRPGTWREFRGDFKKPLSGRVMRTLFNAAVSL